MTRQASVTSSRLVTPCQALLCFSLCVGVMCVGMIIDAIYLSSMPTVLPPAAVSDGSIQLSGIIDTSSESSRRTTSLQPPPRPQTQNVSSDPSNWMVSPTPTPFNSSLIPPFLPCRWNITNIPKQTRSQAFLDCHTEEKTPPKIVFKQVLSNSTPATKVTLPDTSCLKNVIKTRCYDVRTLVPRLAHYVWYGKEKAVMPLHFFIGVLSVVRFLRPCFILFHGEQTPTGVYWEALLQLVPNILYLPRQRPREIFGNVINVVEHAADVTRLQVLLEYGGVYIDIDQYLLRPVTKLLNYSATIGVEKQGSNCGNGLIFSQPDAPFLQRWLAMYSTFRDTEWAKHSTVLPYNLSQEYPHLVHVVDSFFRPNYKDIRPLYDSAEGYPWQWLYGLHLYYRFFHEYFDKETRMDQQRSVIGDLTRHVIFGSWDRCF